MEIEALGEKELILRAKKHHKYKLLLLEIYYKNACKWAKKFLSGIVYTDLVSPTKEEIDSLVYQAFEKAIEKIKPERSDSLSFKNYFYMMVKYQCFAELKGVLKYGVIKNFREEKRMYELDRIREQQSERNQINRMDMTMKVESIMEFLRSRNEVYGQIIEMKMKGHTNEEIGEVLNISPIALKSRVQYIRKLIREHFLSFDGIF